MGRRAPWVSDRQLRWALDQQLDEQAIGGVRWDEMRWLGAWDEMRWGARWREMRWLAAWGNRQCEAAEEKFAWESFERWDERVTERERERDERVTERVIERWEMRETFYYFINWLNNFFLFFCSQLQCTSIDRCAL